MSEVLTVKGHLIKVTLVMFVNPIKPRFPDWNKERLYTQIETEPNNNTERVRITITSPTAE